MAVGWTGTKNLLIPLMGWSNNGTFFLLLGNWVIHMDVFLNKKYPEINVGPDGHSGWDVENICLFFVLCLSGLLMTYKTI